MEITGQIIVASELIYGKSNVGPWNRINFVIEEVDVEHPQRIYLRARGEKAEEIAGMFEREGTAGIWKAYYSHNAHPYERDGEERWVNDITCWKLEPCE